MKNQYVADIGDYGKYSLLKAFTDEKIKVGINWYLTSDDGSTDGRFTDYLNNDNLRNYNPLVFDKLKIISAKPEKSVQDIEYSNMLVGAKYYSEKIEFEGSPQERENLRKRWFDKSLEVLAGSELIFMDPDNGLLETGDAKKIRAEKYILPDEAKQYYESGCNVVFYCHKGRRSLEKWDEYKSFLPCFIPEAKPVVITFHKGTQRSYIFLIHPHNYINLKHIIDKVLVTWNRVFTEEYINYIKN
ncbi:hypothetical protein SAMN02910369_02544 [Lachnospiraceae bacterium NE2001]|nr:hypothetical protein SAMN02910369_02544 [Lachnospiraceae bacterium NE2001]